VAGYQFCITLGLLIASGVNYAVQDRPDRSSYRIPIGIQFAWGVVLAVGIFLLPDSPRYFVKRGMVEKARRSLSTLRGQPAESEYIEAELAEIIANEEYERSIIPAGSWANGWLNCFRGSLFKSNSNVRKTILGTSLQMMQQVSRHSPERHFVKNTLLTVHSGLASTSSSTTRLPSCSPLALSTTPS